ncbi:MAG: hypothetical protein VB858_16790 [Planctomycetaceae bacterium]
MPAHEFQTLLIGHGSAAEFAALLEAVRSSAVPLADEPTAEKNAVQTTADLEDALQMIRDGWFPDIVVVYQGVPDEFPPASIEQLIGVLPLSRFVVIFGPWCESLGRSSQHWPLAWCVPIRHAKIRIEEVFTAQARDLPLISPLTSRDEAFARSALRVNQNDARRCGLTAMVLCNGSDRPFTDLLIDQLQNLGVSLSAGDVSEPDFVFVPATMLSDQVSNSLTELSDQFPDSIRVLISDLLTPGEMDQLHGAGVITVSQLRLGEELVSLFEHV